MTPESMTSRISDVEEGYGAVTEVQRPEGSKLGRFVRLAAVLAVAAVVVVALAGVSSTGQPDQSAATWEYADKRNMALLLQKAKMGTTKLQEDAPAEEEEAPAEEEEAPAEEEAPMHHIKNFAGTEQT